MKSKWCQQDGQHGWCANRNSRETHCTCLCHKLKAQVRAIQDLDNAYKKVRIHLEAELTSLEKRLERFE